jgi:hypothetical protein
MTEIARKIRSECHHCEHRREVAGNAHIQCVKPDANMTGDQHGIRSGWFMYPLLFDPSWKTKKCSNYETAESVNRTVSQSVSAAE